MKDRDWLWILGGAALLYLLYSQRQTIGETMTAITSGWQDVNEGPTWVPVVNQTEDALGIPPNLLARVAYQESHFRREIIDGTLASSAGALGLMQLEPQWFQTVNRPRPYTPQDTTDQISEAGRELTRLYHVFGDWGTALAAYNDGETAISEYLAGKRALPVETRKYVTEVLTDVPIGSTFRVA